jgi:hypothetical protein
MTDNAPRLRGITVADLAGDRTPTPGITAAEAAEGAQAAARIMAAAGAVLGGLSITASPLGRCGTCGQPATGIRYQADRHGNEATTNLPCDHPREREARLP